MTNLHETWYCTTKDVQNYKERSDTSAIYFRPLKCTIIDLGSVLKFVKIIFFAECITKRWRAHANIFWQQPILGQGLIIIEDSRSHSDKPQSVGLLWTSDQPDAESSA